MEEFGKIAERCLAGELAGTFVFKNGTTAHSKTLQRKGGNYLLTLDGVFSNDKQRALKAEIKPNGESTEDEVYEFGNIVNFIEDKPKCEAQPIGNNIDDVIDCLEAECEIMQDKYALLKRIQAYHFQLGESKTHMFMPATLSVVDNTHDGEMTLRTITIPEEVTFEVLDIVRKAYKANIRKLNSELHDTIVKRDKCYGD